MHRLLVPLLLLPLTALAAEDDKRATDEPPLLFAEDFRGGVHHWTPTDSNAWKIIDTDKGKAFSQFRQSKYKPPHRSPLNFALANALFPGDVVLEAQAQSTTKDYPHRDMCMIFGYQDPAHFYYVHLGKKADDHANQIFIVDGADRKKISTKSSDGTPWTDGWHHVKVVRTVGDGAIRVYFDDMKSPVMTATDRRFLWGQVGVGSFDDTGNWADVKVRCRRAEKLR